MSFRRRKFFSLLVLVTALWGCAGPGTEAVLKDIASGAGVFIEGVPLFRQERHRCGPAALASVMGYYGRDLDAEGLENRVFEKRLKGTLSMDMLIYAKESGLNAEYYGGGLEDLKKRVTAGTPPILLLNLGRKAFPLGHYIVVVGYDERMKQVLALTGKERLEAIGYGRLLRAWDRTGYSTLLITPRGGREP